MEEGKVADRALPPGDSRRLTPGEIELVQSVFGAAVNCEKVRIFRRKYFPFQPRRTTMAPNGNVYFPARSPLYRDDFAEAGRYLQGLFMHEMTHVWQHQRGINVWRAVFDRRYRYRLQRGKAFAAYGLEQQCEIVRDWFLGKSDSAPGEREMYAEVLPFGGASRNV